MPSRSWDVTFMVSEMERAISYYEDEVALPKKHQFLLVWALAAAA